MSVRPPTSNDADRGSKTVDKAMLLLNLFMSDRDEATVTELVLASALSKTAVLRLVHSLVRAGYLERKQDGAVRLGRAVAALATAYYRGNPERQSLFGLLRSVANDVGATAQVAVLHEGQALVVMSAEANTPVKVAAEYGHRLPLHATATGKVLAAALDAQTLAATLPPTLQRYTPKTITDRSEFEAELEKVRRNGHGTAIQEMHAGMWSVAVPLVNDIYGTPAALGVVHPCLAEPPSPADTLRDVEMICSVAALLVQPGGPTPVAGDAGR